MTYVPACPLAVCNPAETTPATMQRRAQRNWRPGHAAQSSGRTGRVCSAESADIPSVLVETAFISNPDEEFKLRSNSYQEQLADAVIRDITRYFAENTPLARNRQV